MSNCSLDPGAYDFARVGLSGLHCIRGTGHGGDIDGRMNARVPSMTSVFSFPRGIEFEREETWPAELIELLRANVDLLANYERRRREIDQMLRTDDIASRIYTPVNEFKARRDAIVREAERILSGCVLLGFHCTRLTAAEIGDIKRAGLRSLSDGLLRSRIDRVLSEGVIDRSMAELLLSDHEAQSPYREGQVHFVNSRTLLAEEPAVIRLFRSWGGEALYNCHEGHPLSGPALRRIGVPCLVVVATAIAKLKPNDIGQRFVWRFLSNRDHPISNGDDMQSQMDADLTVDEIVEVIERHDPRFEALTRCSAWHEKV